MALSLDFSEDADNSFQSYAIAETVSSTAETTVRYIS